MQCFLLSGNSPLTIVPQTRHSTPSTTLCTDFVCAYMLALILAKKALRWLKLRSRELDKGYDLVTLQFLSSFQVGQFNDEGE